MQMSVLSVVLTGGHTTEVLVVACHRAATVLVAHSGRGHVPAYLLDSRDGAPMSRCLPHLSPDRDPA